MMLSQIEAKMLYRLKIMISFSTFIFVVHMLLFVVTSFEAWPITRWPMFSGMALYPAPQQSFYELRLIDTSGNIVILPSQDFYKDISVSGRATLSRIVLYRTFVLDNAETIKYRRYLIDYIERIFPDNKFTEVMLYDINRQVDLSTTPPTLLDESVSQELLGMFEFSLYEIK